MSVFIGQTIGRYVRAIGRKIAWGVGIATWALVSAVGFARLWKYEGAAGTFSTPPTHWPSQAERSADAQRATLVMLLHPKCPCSRATIDELAKVMTHCQGQLTARVLVVRPEGAGEGWEQTDLWRGAAAIPGVTLVADQDGRQARMFSGTTSGQTLLYTADGELLFSGGITASRGHSGDNAGRSIIEGLLSHEIERSKSRQARTPVYGCPLFDTSADGTGLCRK